MAMTSRTAALSRCFVALSLQLWLETAATPGQWPQKEDDQGRTVQQMQIQAPVMTEEDQYGYIMPDRYRCDSCRAVVYHLKDVLERRQPKSRRLQAWERQEIFEETCQNGFKGYGIQFKNGENVLSGPAFMQKQSELSPGMAAMQMGGENWERRLGEICRKIVFDDVGEDELYELFRAGNLTDEVCRTATRACQATAPKRATKKAESTPKRPNTKSTSGERVAKTADGGMDAASFLASLASQRGHADVKEFYGKHDRKHWEGLLLQAAEWLLEGTNSRGNVGAGVDRGGKNAAAVEV
jgi:hypothetical protein